MKLLSGLPAGAIAAIVASLVSLPLDSPDDVIFNTATVTVAALVVGLWLGVVWQVLGERPSGLVLYGGAAIATFGVAVVVALISEPLLSGSIRFMLPIEATVFLIAAPLVPLLTTLSMPRTYQLGSSGAAVVVALAIGIGLSGQGDSESGRLELPDVSAPTTAPTIAGQTPPASETPAASVVTIDDVAGKVYTVVADESELTYTVREKLANLPASSDAVGRTSSLSGTLRLDGMTEVTADLSTLSSDQDRRDNYIRQNLFSTDPNVIFVVDALPALPDEYTEGETYTGTITGTATIRGVQGPITMEVEARLIGDELQVVGRTDFTWDDFDIPPPNTPVVTVEDNVHIEVLIIARTTA
jgi:polyisoprenoid-binding protein YceI